MSPVSASMQSYSLFHCILYRSKFVWLTLLGLIGDNRTLNTNDRMLSNYILSLTV